jgi:hypothetical protein
MPRLIFGPIFLQALTFPLFVTGNPAGLQPGFWFSQGGRV